MKKVLLVALLCACGGDSDPAGDTTTCSPAWSDDPRSCEIACVDIPNYTDSGTCGARNPHVDGVVVFCMGTFEYGGRRGCCQAQEAPDATPGVFDIRFFACD